MRFDQDPEIEGNAGRLLVLENTDDVVFASVFSSGGNIGGLFDEYHHLVEGDLPHTLSPDGTERLLDRMAYYAEEEIDFGSQPHGLHGTSAELVLESLGITRGGPTGRYITH